METKCLNCERTSQQVPLIALAYRGETLHICPQCLPSLIHQPQNLVDRLPGAENFKPGADEQ